MSASRKRKSPDATPALKSSQTHSRKRRKLSVPSDDTKCTDPASSLIQFDIRSWCYMDTSPFTSYIKLTNNSSDTHALKTFDSPLSPLRRGHRIVVIDGITGDVEQSICFDTWADIYAGIRLRIFLKTLQFKPHKWVIIITHDSGYNINAQSAWTELQYWGANQDTHPLHREAYIFIFSTNVSVKWWEHIQYSQFYFDKKYDRTVHSYNKKLLKKYKKCQKNTNNNSQNISQTQLTLLKITAENVFFERTCKEGKGALVLKGFLPRMKPCNVEQSRMYQSPSPVELALKKGIQPCDNETNTFYCVSCVNTADSQHLLVCMDSIHENDENMCNVLLRENETAFTQDEFDQKYRVCSAGQCFHIYCVTYPEHIWQRWCNFMGIAYVSRMNETPSFVTANIKKQQKIWKLTDFSNLHRSESDDSDSEEFPVMDTGNIDPYLNDYSDTYKLTPQITDLSQYLCHFHSDGRQGTHLMYCRCGNPMVQQMCSNADGETERDLQSDFKGLYCNNYSQGCTKRIEPNEVVFRCMNGARCKDSKDGSDYCMKCMTEKVKRVNPKLLCLCGEQLLLGTVNDVRRIFDAKKSENKRSEFEMKEESVESVQKKKKRIKNAQTYRCAWCLKKFESKSENVYFCDTQSEKCQRIIKVRSNILYQPFAVCIGCIVHSQWMTQTCLCGRNLHCRLLADWIHNDTDAYGHNISETVPQRPNGQKPPMQRIKTSMEYNAIDFYEQRRANDDEHLYWEQMSVKYVNCSVCETQINAYQFVFICNNADTDKHLQGQRTCYLCGICAISNRRKQTLYPSCDEKVEICLLFIAHDGVSQSELWERWLSDSGNHGLGDKFGVAVQCNNFYSLKTGMRAFAEKYRIDVQRPTEWGKLLVPLTIQKSLQISLSKYPNCQRFYIISGREIPLVSAAHLYAMPSKTQLMAKKITNNSSTATRICKKRIGKALQWYSHHAAMCLERSHCELVSVCPWKEYFGDFDNVYDNIGAPDEFLFGTTLNAFGVDMRSEVWREVTTDFELPPVMDVRHPMLFDSLDSESEFWIVNETMDVKGKERKSLKQLLCDRYTKPHRLWGYGPCFFRKVGAGVKFGEFVPWELCKMRPPIIDADRGVDETKQYRPELDSAAYMEMDEIEQLKLNMKSEL